MNLTKIAIVILNYKNYSDTIHCIESIFQYSQKDSFTVFVIDNASNNNSLDHIAKHFQHQYKMGTWNEKDVSSTQDVEIVLIQNDKNYGYAYGNNIGLKIGYDKGYKYLLVLNNDTLFIENTLPKLQSVIDHNEKALCVGPVLLKKDRVSIDYNCAKRRPTYMDIFRHSYFGKWLKTKNWEKEYYYLKKIPSVAKPVIVDVISGSCMFFSAQKIKEIDFFENDTFLYYEEAILAEKGRSKGYAMLLDPTARLIHLGAKTTKEQITSRFAIQCEYQSLKLYLRKYRKLSRVETFFVSLSNNIFLKLYSLVKK